MAGRVRVAVITLAHSRVLPAKLLLRPGERNMALAACHGDPAPPTSARTLPLLLLSRCAFTEIYLRFLERLLFLLSAGAFSLNPFSPPDRMRGPPHAESRNAFAAGLRRAPRPGLEEKPHREPRASAPSAAARSPGTRLPAKGDVTGPDKWPKQDLGEPQGRGLAFRGKAAGGAGGWSLKSQRESQRKQSRSIKKKKRKEKS